MIKKIESHCLEDYLLKEKNLQNENGIIDAVREIIQEVKDSGNEALLKFINKHEGKKLKSIDEVLFNQDFLEDKFNSLSDKDRNMLIYMSDRIERGITKISLSKHSTVSFISNRHASTIYSPKFHF